MFYSDDIYGFLFIIILLFGILVFVKIGYKNQIEDEEKIFNNNSSFVKYSNCTHIGESFYCEISSLVE